MYLLQKFEVRKKRKYPLAPHVSSYPGKPAIHQFAEASYLDQHGVCLNMVALDKVMEWQLHTNAIGPGPPFDKTPTMILHRRLDYW